MFNGPENDEVTAKWVEQIAFIAKRDGEVIGVTWVNPVKVSSLNNNFFLEFRIFISPYHRVFPLVSRLTLKTREFFEQNPAAIDQPCIGLIAVIENEKMKKKWNIAEWPGVDMTFVGYTLHGHHIRVSYFKGARIG